MSDRFVIYCFHASWCHSCPRVWKSFLELKDEMETENFKFVDLDVEDDEGIELSSKYQVRNVPTILITKSDRVLVRIVGTRSKEEIKKELELWK